MINEKEEDDMRSEKSKKIVPKRAFLARGSGKAGGVGNPHNQPLISSTSQPKIGIISPREETSTAFGKKSKSVGVVGRINASKQQQAAMSTTSNSFIESKYKNPYAAPNTSGFDLTNKNN